MLVPPIIRASTFRISSDDLSNQGIYIFDIILDRLPFVSLLGYAPFATFLIKLCFPLFFELSEPFPDSLRPLRRYFIYTPCHVSHLYLLNSFIACMLLLDNTIIGRNKHLSLWLLKANIESSSPK